MRDQMCWTRPLQALWHCKVVPGAAKTNCAFHTIQYFTLEGSF